VEKAVSDYRPEYCQKLIDHMARGLSIKSFCGVIDVDEKTIYNWLQRHPEFMTARMAGEAKRRYFFEQTGVGGLTGKIKGFSAPMWIFHMKNIYPDEWNDRIQLQNEYVAKWLSVPREELLAAIPEALKMLQGDVTIDVKSTEASGDTTAQP
jgi:hypothetical protein